MPRLSCLFFCCFIFCANPVQAEAVNFELMSADGVPQQLSDYRGQWIIVNFWATWCGPCVQEIPELVSFQKNNPQYRVLGIDFEDAPDMQALEAFRHRFNINYPILLIGETPLIPFEPLKGLPTTAIVGPQGNMIAHHTGPVSAQMLEQFINNQVSAAATANNSAAK
ncbi:MAG: TlpA family protein disulfide reductase [gamma proteobacterium symbiont of Bathyaustriella thionipta]|nr:TlpA family protein disulfide reductase [gamma proteobacterium symbiont of Bathyaustriella thionipta]